MLKKSTYIHQGKYNNLAINTIQIGLIELALTE